MIIKRVGIVIMLMIFFMRSVANADPRFAAEPDGATQARSVVERIIISAYEQALDSKDFPYSEFKLVNAPISGYTNRRGRHLLSFSAFNQFPLLAKWGLDHGAKIDLGDKDASNMLRMSVGNYNIVMVDLALNNGANPNILIGEGNDTMLSGLVKWGWPESGFLLARDFGARPRTEEERKEIIKYVNALPKEQISEDINFFDRYFLGEEYLEEYLESVPLASGVLPESGRADLIKISMIDLMDSALMTALKAGDLSGIVMDQFYVKGKSFEAFLVFNGFIQTLVKRLNSMDQEKMIAVANRLDFEGNDLLVAAIKSKDDKTVEAILNVTNENVNKAISSDNEWYYSKGQRPLHIAVQWGVSARIFELLVANGADPDLKNASGTSAKLLFKYYKENWDGQGQELSKIRSILYGK